MSMKPTQSTAVMSPLEGRQLFSAFHASINFQPRGDVPGGWTADTGVKYSQQGELTFGWNQDNRTKAYNRHTDAILRYDTLAFMGIGDSATTWQIAVPNGLYHVGLVAGDARYTNSRYAFDVEGETLLDRKPNGANHWRKADGLVWVSDGKLTVTSAAGAVNNKINCITVDQVDPHVTGTDISNPFSLSGIVQNEVPTGTAIPLLQQLGAKNVKLWYDVDWNAQPKAWDFKNLARYKKAGFTTTVTFGTKVVPTYDQAKAFFTRIAAYPGATDLIDFWEIGNEPNHPNFWTGTAPQFVDQFMKPAYEVLHPLGEPTIGGGVTYDVNYCSYLQSIGYSNYCDYAGYHPYGSDGATVVQLATQAKAAFGGKPLFVTEWNVVGNADHLDDWAHQVDLATTGLRQVAYMSFYFALETSVTHVGAGGVFDNSLAPNGDFYTVIKKSMS